MDISHQDFFLQHLGALSHNEAIDTSEDVLDALLDMKLIVAGERIGPATLRRLGRIQLKKPIAASIRFLDPITVPAIKLHMQKSVASSPGINLLLRATRQQQMALDCVNQVSLPLPLLNILTVMSRQTPALYEHSLDVSLISTCLGILRRRSIAELVQLSCIGLFHDVGSLFLDPSLIDKERALSWAEWRQIYTHPTLGNEVLQSAKTLHANVAEAVLQHHERIDGSGYPNGLSGAALGDLGRIAAVAEVAAAVSRHKSKDYLTTVLNANAGKLDDELLETLHRILARVSGDEFVAALHNAATFRLVDAVSDALARWRLLDRKVVSHRALDKVYSGLYAVERLVSNSGFSTEQLGVQDTLITLKLSPQATDAFNEARYQLGQVLHDVHRNKAVYMAIEPQEVSAAFGRWVAETERRLATVEEADEA